MEHQTRCNLVAAHHLEEVADRDDLALFGTQREKAVYRSFQMTHGYGFCRRAGLEHASQRHSRQPTSQTERHLAYDEPRRKKFAAYPAAHWVTPAQVAQDIPRP